MKSKEEIIKEQLIKEITAAFLVKEHTKKPSHLIIQDLANKISSLYAPSLPEHKGGEQANLLYETGGTDWQSKVMFYREQTDKLRKYLFDNNIGLPNQPLVDAILDHLKSKGGELYSKEAVEEDLSKPLTQCMAGRDGECNHPNCPVTDEDCKNGKYCTLPLYDWRQ